MIDQHQRLNGVVKDELAKVAPTLGIDKSQVGFFVNPSFAPMQQPGGQVGIMFAWVVTVTYRVPLLGYPVMGFPVVIPTPPGALPDDDAFRGAAKMGLESANDAYQKILKGEAA
jgi:hypothetical protein